jgi:putative polyhydroxyalkanoate system protein
VTVQLTVTRKYDADAQSLRRRLEAMLMRLKSRYGATVEWIDDATLSIGAPGVRGRLEVGPRQLEVSLDLSAMLRPLRGRIEKELGKELDRVTHPED